MARTRVTHPKPLEEHPVDPDYACAFCVEKKVGDGKLFVTPSGRCCAIHGGDPPTASIGKQLAQVLLDSDREEANRRARDFVSGGSATEKPIDPRFPPLVAKTFLPGADWDAVFDRFGRWLSLGDNRGQEQFIRRAHEEGPEIVRDLYRTYLDVRAAREEWELRNDAMLGSMREQANDVLQAEKNKGLRSKAITEGDLDKKVAQMFSEAYVEQETKRRRYKAVEERAKHDVEVAQLRCRVLDTMMNRLRPT